MGKFLKSLLISGMLLLGFAFLSSGAKAQNKNPLDTFQPCLEATQHLKAPEQIVLVDSNEKKPAFTFLFSQSRTDFYAVRIVPGIWRVLAVFQNEQTRKVQADYFYAVSVNNSDLVSWEFWTRSPYGPNLQLIADLKYEVLEFNWLKIDFPPPGQEIPQLTHADFYAPASCVPYKSDVERLNPGDPHTGFIGSYNNVSPSPLPSTSPSYRAAEEMLKMARKEVAEKQPGSKKTRNQL